MTCCFPSSGMVCYIAASTLWVKRACNLLLKEHTEWVRHLVNQQHWQSSLIPETGHITCHFTLKILEKCFWPFWDIKNYRVKPLVFVTSFNKRWPWILAVQKKNSMSKNYNSIISTEGFPNIFFNNFINNSIYWLNHPASF